MTNHMAPSHFDAAPFFGRHEERRNLDDLVSLIENGLSGAVVFLGDPGVGKTRLLECLHEASESVRTIHLVGLESEVRLPFAALHRLLEPHFNRIDRLPTPQRDALLITFGMLDGSPPARLLIGLGTLSLLADAATEQQLICVVDDAQWLDRESLGTLAFVARRVHADGIGFVFAGRENQPELQVLDGLATHHLAGLGTSDASSLLNAITPHNISPSIAARLVTETGGNPLALVELVKQLTPGQLEGQLPLPQRLLIGSGLIDYFQRQVELLPAQTRSLLLLASAMSDENAASLWRAATLIGLSPESMDAAARVGLIRVDDRVAFRHPLIRSAVYGSGTLDERRASHAALAAIADLEDHPDLTAWHRAAAVAAPNEEIAAQLERSAVHAEQRGGQAAQALFLARAAELSPGKDDRNIRLFAAAQAYLAAGDGVQADALLEKAATWLGSTEMRVDLQRLRASIAVFFSRHKDAPAILLEAARHVDPNESGVIRAILFDALQAALVARGYIVGLTPADVALSVLHTRSPERPSTKDLLLDGFAARLAVDFETAAPLLRASVKQLFTDEQSGAPELPSIILGWFAAEDVWDDEALRSMFDRAAVMCRRHGALGALRIALAGLCVSQALAGQLAKAEQSYFEAADISSLIGVPPPATTGVLLEVRAWQGREQESRETAALTSAWGKEHGAEILEIFSWSGLTILEIGLGNYSAAARWAREIFRRDPPGFGNRILPEIVEACTRTGETAFAQEALDRLSERARASGTPWANGMLARSRALIASGEEAETYYLEAIEHLAATSVHTELARAHLLFGEWLRRRKRRRDARLHLTTAHDMFLAMGAMAFATRARSELLATGYQSTVDTLQLSLGLTSQETQVARLAAAGAMNAEIAEQMFVTTSTVEYHLSKVFRKLGISSRRQLTSMLQ
ncbi:DNA-binding CsgD family transcriptional regulator [Mycetocola sp. CAN_C7]|uniref:helix-turn-helix transcriptional regulator n=1 Tax=Mycetocola sp. CAN_C7 TaxID=2787724 RepID=UPI0018CAC9D9